MNLVHWCSHCYRDCKHFMISSSSPKPQLLYLAYLKKGDSSLFKRKVTSFFKRKHISGLLKMQWRFKKKKSSVLQNHRSNFNQLGTQHPRVRGTIVQMKRQKYVQRETIGTYWYNTYSFLKFLQNCWTNFNQSWYKSSLGKGD